MDWSLFASTFAAVFLAELGDKTQVATLSLSAESRAPWTVFLGSALALVATSALAAAFGGLVARWVPTVWLQRLAGAVFLALGAWTLWRAGRGE